MEQLAIFGGPSVRKTDIYYGRQCVDEEDIQAVIDVLHGRLITCGPHVTALENKLAETVQSKYANLKRQYGDSIDTIIFYQ